MSKEEEAPARVTRGALRRMSVEQEPPSAPGTPKKTAAAAAATSKKVAVVLDAIQEGSNGPSDAEVEEDATATRTTAKSGKKDTSLVGGNQSMQRLKEQDKKQPTGRRSRVASLTEENVSMMESQHEGRRTPRRRPSQDQTPTPQTLPKRVTRRNSVTSDEGTMAVGTPKTSKPRQNVAAPAVIIEDVEKEEQAATTDADLSDLDIRKLRNRSIDRNSPIPRASPSSSRNASMTAAATNKDEEALSSPTKGGGSEPSSPLKLETSALNISHEQKKLGDSKVDVTVTPTTSKTSISSSKDSAKKGQPTAEKESPVAGKDASTEQESIVEVVPLTPTKSGGQAAASKDVKFEEATPEQELNKSKYPKTPIAAAASTAAAGTGSKRRKLSERADESLKATSEVIIIDETIKDSPQEVDQKTKSPAKTPSKPAGTPKKSTVAQPVEVDESPDKSIDASLANIAEKVSEDLNQTTDDLSILGTPKPIGGGGGGKHKSHFAHLREGSSSTPIAAGKQAPLEEIPEKEEDASSPAASKSWSQAVKGSGKGKGIDVFSVRKQEEEAKEEEQAKALNESLKRKSLEKRRKSAKIEEGDEEDEEEEEEEDERNSFVDDEAMEVDDYESGDSMDSEARADMEDHEAKERGESIGSQDTDVEDEEDDDDDSFIASDGEEEDELLEGTGDDLHSEEEEENKRDKKKTRKRIVQMQDSSEDEQQTEKITLDETTASESKSPKKNLDVSKVGSPKKTPTKSSSPVKTAESAKKTPAKTTTDENHEEVLEKSTDKLNTSKSISNSSLTEQKTPTKNTSHDQKTPESAKSAKKTPAKALTPQAVPKSPKSPKKTPSKQSLESETKEAAKSAEKRPFKTMETNEETSDSPKSRKSLPAPALISADFYSSSAKKAKRSTINVMANGTDKEQPEAEPESNTTQDELSNLVTNPAALALARKNKRLSQGLSPAPVATSKQQDKRASLPGKLPAERELDSPLKKKSNKGAKKEEDEVEPMEVDEEDDDEEVAVEPSPKKAAAVQKKKPKDLSEFDTEAILSRCNEIVRADKEKRKEGATLRQKKKDEKRRQREQEKQEEAAGEGEANESAEQPQKKKKKKKKIVNYLLEELGETKEDQVARALQRKMALLEAKRERKKAKKAAKLREQLNKENEQAEKHADGITAKLEKKAKKAKQAAKEEEKPVVLEEKKPVVKRAISAFAMYSAQIEELKKEQAEKKKPKSKKQLKEKNQQPTAVEEVHAALQDKSEPKSKKDKSAKHKQAKVEENAASVEVPTSSGEHSKAVKKKDVSEECVPEVPAKEVAVVEKQKKKDKPPAVESDASAPPKKKKLEKANTAPLKSVLSLDEELAELKKALSDTVTKVVKKQKLSHKEPSTAPVAIVREVTPPPKPTTGKLKALSRLESGFHEEPVTPDHKLLKRNHGFKEEPVTPKTVGFKVSSVLPAGQEALKQEAVEAKKKKTYHNTNRIRPEDVKEPPKGLPLPIWTRSGAFEVEELAESAKPKKASKKSSDDYVPLTVGGGSTEFVVKPLGGKGRKEDKTNGVGVSKAHRIDLATVDEAVINFKKQAIFGKNAHLREKKSKH